MLAATVVTNGIAKVVAAAVSKTRAESDLKASETRAAHSIAVAQKDADIIAKDNQIAFMAKQIASLEQTISDERKARVDMAASAAQQQGVVVNTSGK